MVKIFDESEDKNQKYENDPVLAIQDCRTLLEDAMTKNTAMWDNITAAVNQLAIVSKFFRNNP